jgi:hypothetical protein
MLVVAGYIIFVVIFESLSGGLFNSSNGDSEVASEIRIGRIRKIEHKHGRVYPSSKDHPSRLLDDQNFFHQLAQTLSRSLRLS